MTKSVPYIPKKGEYLEQYIHGMTFENHFNIEKFKIVMYNGIEYIHVQYRSPRSWRWFTAFFENKVLKEYDSEIVTM